MGDHRERLGRRSESTAGTEPTQIYSAGFAAPILWGASEGYGVAEIATGLELDRQVVLDVLAEFTSVRPSQPTPGAADRAREAHARLWGKAPRKLRIPQPVAKVDRNIDDPKYRAWLRASWAASEQLVDAGATLSAPCSGQEANRFGGPP